MDLYQIPPAMCGKGPGCDYNDLFGNDLGFIFSGTIIQYDNYIFSDALDGKHDLSFACHTIKIHVDRMYISSADGFITLVKKLIPKTRFLKVKKVFLSQAASQLC